MHVPHDVIVSMSLTKEIIFDLWLHIMSHIVLFFLASFNWKLQQWVMREALNTCTLPMLGWCAEEYKQPNHRRWQRTINNNCTCVGAETKHWGEGLVNIWHMCVYSEENHECAWNCIFFLPFSDSSKQKCILYTLLNYFVVFKSNASLLKGSVLTLQQQLQQ